MNTTAPAPGCAHAPRRERRKQARPGELLEAALALFVEKGFAATRMEEVAVRAGVSKGTVFLYFPSKLDLFKAVVRENISGRFQEWNAGFDQYEGGSAELLRDAMLIWWQRVGATQASGISKLMLSEGGNFPEVAEFFRQEVVQPGQAILGRVIARGIARGEFRPVPIDHAVQGVISIMIFLALSKHTACLCTKDGMTLDPVAYLAEQADIVARGLAARPAGAPPAPRREARQ
jgi:TetR/AcrR family transcriptional regulator